MKTNDKGMKKIKLPSIQPGDTIIIGGVDSKGKTVSKVSYVTKKKLDSLEKKGTE